MNDFATFFAGAFAGSLVTFTAMCFAFCAGSGEKENDNESDTDQNT